MGKNLDIHIIIIGFQVSIWVFQYNIVCVNIEICIYYVVLKNINILHLYLYDINLYIPY
jgi:hypothetical protein